MRNPGNTKSKEMKVYYYGFPYRNNAKILEKHYFVHSID